MPKLLPCKVISVPCPPLVGDIAVITGPVATLSGLLEPPLLQP
jgi:hypothetical protein